MESLFQPTRPLRGATSYSPWSEDGEFISTHAPLAGRDNKTEEAFYVGVLFQPTRPLRGATAVREPFHAILEISTHAPLAGRDRFRGTIALPKAISTHAPLAGRDFPRLLRRPENQDFNPRAPCGARRAGGQYRHQGLQISTHAPLAGRDILIPLKTLKITYFNPRAPCGARRQSHQ